MITIFLFSFIILVTLAALFWKKIVKKQIINAGVILLALVFPLCHLLTAIILRKLTDTDGILLEINKLTYIISGIIADVVLLIVLFTRENKEAVEEKYRQMENLREIQSVQNAAMLSKEAEIKRVKEAFLEEINQLVLEMETGNSTGSKEILERTNKQMGWGEYSRNPVVNMLINERKRICEEKDIDFEITWQFGEDYNMTAVEICSLFSNLLDNAIKAADTSQSHKKTITLQTAMAGDYAVIKVTNTADEHSQKIDTSRKHYGKVIIDDIAQRYNGEYSGNWDKKKSIYEATVILLQRKED